MVKVSRVVAIFFDFFGDIIHEGLPPYLLSLPCYKIIGGRILLQRL